MAAYKCMICGGDLANDYLLGSCVCENCGNKWSLEDLEPTYKQYIHIIEKLNTANDLLAGENAGVKQAEQAVLLYKSAAAECINHTTDIGSDLMELCKNGQERAGLIKAYAGAKSHFDKKAYDKALAEFEKLNGYKDSEEMVTKCREQIVLARKRRIPYAVIVGMILPAILFFFMKEKGDVSMALCLLVFIAASAGLGYAVYLNGALSVVVEVLSLIMLVPLLIFTVLVYVFHISTGLAAGLAVGVPFVIVVLIMIFAERQ